MAGSTRPATRPPTRRRQTPARLVNTLLTEAGFDPATLAERRETFREESEDEIRRVVAELRKQSVLVGVDRTRYRGNLAPALVLDKVAEAVALTLRYLRYERTLREERAKEYRALSTLRDGYRHMARQLRPDDPREAAGLAKRADMYADLAKHSKGDHPRPRLPGYPDVSPSMHLNRLVLDLVAILTHATNLTQYQLLGQHVPAILSALWECGRGYVPSRGAENPLKRYKDSAKRIKERLYALGDDDHTLAEDMRLGRAKLFAGDDRFPLSLFDPHRTIRTIPRRAARR